MSGNNTKDEKERFKLYLEDPAVDPIDKIKALSERLDLANKMIAGLRAEIREKNKVLKTLLDAHSHDSQGRAVVPTPIVNI